MNCEKLIEDLSAWQDGELDSVHAARIEEHLRTCESCASRLAGYEKVFEMMARLPGPQTAHDFAGRTAGKAALIPAAGSGLFTRFKTFAAVAASVALAASLGFVALRWPASERVSKAPVMEQPLPADGEGYAQAIANDPELAGILDDLDTIEKIDLLENLPLLENMEMIESSGADEIATAADDLIPDELPLEER